MGEDTGVLSLSTETTTPITPVKKKDKLFGMDTEDIALGLGAAAVAGDVRRGIGRSASIAFAALAVLAELHVGDVWRAK